MDWTLREGHAGDAPVIAGFNRRLALETEHKDLDPATVAAGVRHLLAHPALGRYYVAEQDGRVIGQLMITFEWSDWRNGTFWWLQSVYVDAAHRGRGVFGSLCRHVEALARADGGVCGIRLYVEGNNAAARAVYARLGFDDAGYRVLERMLPRGGA